MFHYVSLVLFPSAMLRWFGIDSSIAIICNRWAEERGVRLQNLSDWGTDNLAGCGAPWQMLFPLIWFHGGLPLPEKRFFCQERCRGEKQTIGWYSVSINKRPRLLECLQHRAQSKRTGNLDASTLPEISLDALTPACNIASRCWKQFH